MVQTQRLFVLQLTCVKLVRALWRGLTRAVHHINRALSGFLLILYWWNIISLLEEVGWFCSLFRGHLTTSSSLLRILRVLKEGALVLL